eukprot:Lankesteria_metandrocarpae@DN9726_c0_g1_i1.p1
MNNRNTLLRQHQHQQHHQHQQSLRGTFGHQMVEPQQQQQYESYLPRHHQNVLLHNQHQQNTKNRNILGFDNYHAHLHQTPNSHNGSSPTTAPFVDGLTGVRTTNITPTTTVNSFRNTGNMVLNSSRIQQLPCSDHTTADTMVRQHHIPYHVHHQHQQHQQQQQHQQNQQQQHLHLDVHRPRNTKSNSTPVNQQRKQSSSRTTTTATTATATTTATTTTTTATATTATGGAGGAGGAPISTDTRPMY